MRYAIAAALIAALIPLPSLAQTGVSGSPGPPAGVSGPPGIFGFDLGPNGDPASVAREGGKRVRISADWSELEPARGKFV